MPKQPKDEGKYPEHDKLKKVVDISQQHGEFLDWVRGKYTLAEYHGDTLYPARIDTNDLLAEFFSIDLTKIETEKRAMLEEIRVNNS